MWKNLGMKCHDTCILLSNGKSNEKWGGEQRERGRGSEEKKKQCGQVLTTIKIKKIKLKAWHVKT